MKQSEYRANEALAGSADAYAKRLDDMTRHLLTKQLAGRVKVPALARASVAQYVAAFNHTNRLKA